MSRFNTILKSIPYAVAAVATTATIIAPVAVSAWGPDRALYCIKGSPIACPISNPAGEVADKVTFNSILNNPAHGDERNFMQIKEKDASNSTYTDSITLQPGKTYTVFMYYHNNASSSLNASGKGIAHDTNIRAAIPALVSDKDTKAVGYVKSKETAQVWDDITVKSANDGQIALRLVKGSAKLYNHNDGAGNATKVTTLSDNIVTAQGATIGYNLDSNGNVKLDGVIPGCNEYSGYVTFDLVADQANFTVNKQVRINNDGKATGGWVESVTAKKGDTLNFLIEYKNTGTTQQNDVVIKDTLPDYLEYVKGSTRFANSIYPTSTGGAKATDDIFGRGINVGNYAPGSNVLVSYTVKVKEVPCDSKNTLKNVGRVETNNGAKEDDATVYVNGDECKETLPEVEMCEIPGKTHLKKDDPDCKEDPTTPETPNPTEELPKTGAGSVVTGVMGIGSLATAGAYYIKSRKKLNN